MISATDDEVLGGETLTALDACRWGPSFNYRDAKLTDWPAYQASGETSVKRFEQRWRKLRVAGANEHNLMWELSVKLDRDHDLALTATVAHRDDRTRLGEALTYVNHQAQLFEGL
ncbi:MAG: hypothetical protein Q8M22_08085 [Actinomycetota bacterium]|nr:hypothetical protein [Actinomycetota bacterium]